MPILTQCPQLHTVPSGGDSSRPPATRLARRTLTAPCGGGATWCLVSVERNQLESCAGARRACSQRTRRSLQASCAGKSTQSVLLQELTVLSCVAAQRGKPCGSTKRARQTCKRAKQPFSGVHVFICRRFSTAFPFFHLWITHEVFVKAFPCFNFRISAFYFYFCPFPICTCLFEVKNLSKLSPLPYIHSVLFFFKFATFHRSSVFNTKVLPKSSPRNLSYSYMVYVQNKYEALSKSVSLVHLNL